jgi:hypothetical protein
MEYRECTGDDCTDMEHKVGCILFMAWCDDCGREYEWPPYYTFPEESCVSTRDFMQLGERVEASWPAEDGIEHGDDCTGNLCPACAGPYLEPDDPSDWRRPIDNELPDDEPFDNDDYPSEPGGTSVWIGGAPQ